MDNGGIFRISGLSFSTPPIFKAKKFACRALRGRGSKSGIRVIYAYNEKEDRIDLIEIYFKGDKENVIKKKGLTTAKKVRFERLREGKCVQIHAHWSLFHRTGNHRKD